MTDRGFYTLLPDGARLVLRVIPNAKTDRIEGSETRADGACALKIRVSAPPDKGAANAAILALLAKSLRLPRSALTLASGQTSRTKTVLVSADPAGLREALDALAR